ncbi:MAG: hypothetical protein M0R50_00530 [Candidatus Cloacimonetes bacterium]|jgi:hypothetical protein|nr:hypothetical protein [Candidatus Cloacimonadota bacterium]
MKKIIVSLVMVIIVFGAFAKKKKDTAEFQLILDDSQFETEEAQIAYANSISGDVLTILPSLYASVASMGKDFTPIMVEFQSAKEDIAYANEIMLQALDLRKDVVAAQAATDAAAAGNAGQVMTEKSAEAEARLQEMADNKTELSELQKAWMKAGLMRMGSAVIRETALVVAVKQYTDNSKSLKGIAKTKEAKNLAAAASMAAEIPTMLSQQGNTLKNLLAIASVNNIEVPAEIKLP